MAQPFLRTGEKRAAAFVLPIIAGHVGVAESLRVSGGRIGLD